MLQHKDNFPPTVPSVLVILGDFYHFIRLKVNKLEQILKSNTKRVRSFLIGIPISQVLCVSSPTMHPLTELLGRRSKRLKYSVGGLDNISYLTALLIRTSYPLTV